MTALALLLLACPQVAARGQARVFVVPRDQPTIQAAIDAASDGDGILVRPGTYHEDVDFKGKAVTLESLGGPAVTTIHGNGSGVPAVRFWNEEGTDSRLIGFTITGGSTHELTYGAGGGVSAHYEEFGMPPLAATPYVADCVITENADSNLCATRGLGIGGNAIVERCVISENVLTAWPDGPSLGGGVWGAPTLVDCLIENNAAGQGGGVHLLDGARVVGCTIRGNWTFVEEYSMVAGGGGIFVTSDAGDILIRDTQIVDNFAWGPPLDFAGNCDETTGTRGGGVRIIGAGPAVLLECLVARNTAGGPGLGGNPTCGLEGGVDGWALLFDTTVEDNQP